MFVNMFVVYSMLKSVVEQTMNSIAIITENCALLLAFVTHSHNAMFCQSICKATHMYRITKNSKNFRETQCSSVSRKSFAQGRSVNRHVCVTGNFSKKTFAVF